MMKQSNISTKSYRITLSKEQPRRIFIQGDCSAKIGTETYDHSRSLGIDKMNERGLRLLDFPRSHKITAANTLFSHKISDRTTWHAPNGNIQN